MCVRFMTCSIRDFLYEIEKPKLQMKHRPKRQQKGLFNKLFGTTNRKADNGEGGTDTEGNGNGSATLEPSDDELGNEEAVLQGNSLPIYTSDMQICA